VSEYRTEGVLETRFHNLFLAFLVSYFVSPVLVWLGIEYGKLAKVMNELGTKASSQQLQVASKRFKVASMLTFTSFVAGMAVYIWLFISLFLAEFSILESLEVASLSNSLLGMLDLAFLFSIALLALGIATNFVLLDAWSLLQSSLVKEIDNPAAQWPLSFHANRVIKGLKYSIVAAFFSAALIPLYMVVFPFLFGMLNSAEESLVLGSAGPIAWMVIDILLLALVAVGSIVGLIGTINQGIGLFDFAKSLRTPPMFDRGGMGARLPPEPARFQSPARPTPGNCPRCNIRLPGLSDIAFCPNCGLEL